MKIHFQGHGGRKDPAHSTDLFKGVKAPGDGKHHPAFRTWDDPKSLGANGVMYDFELEAKVLAIRDALAAQRAKNKKLTASNTQVMVQVDTCFAKSILGKLVGAAGVSTAWSSGPSCTQQFPAKHGSPWVKGFYQAFAGKGGDIDPEKCPTIEEAHKAASDETNAFDAKQDKPINPQADYDPHGQAPMRPKEPKS